MPSALRGGRSSRRSGFAPAPSSSGRGTGRSGATSSGRAGRRGGGRGRPAGAVASRTTRSRRYPSPGYSVAHRRAGQRGPVPMRELDPFPSRPDDGEGRPDTDIGSPDPRGIMSGAAGEVIMGHAVSLAGLALISGLLPTGARPAEAGEA